MFGNTGTSEFEFENGLLSVGGNWKGSFWRVSGEFARFFQEITGLAAGPVLGSCLRDTNVERPRQSAAF